MSFQLKTLSAARLLSASFAVSRLLSETTACERGAEKIISIFFQPEFIQNNFQKSKWFKSAESLTAAIKDRKLKILWHPLCSSPIQCRRFLSGRYIMYNTVQQLVFKPWHPFEKACASTSSSNIGPLPIPCYFFLSSEKYSGLKQYLTNRSYMPGTCTRTHTNILH